MKAQNTFKEAVLKEKSSYKAAMDALIGTAIVFAVSILLTLLSYKIALGFILFCILYTVMLLRFTQQRNN
jgi:Flp pilus assembly protein TadB